MERLQSVAPATAVLDALRTPATIEERPLPALVAQMPPAQRRNMEAVLRNVPLFVRDNGVVEPSTDGADLIDALAADAVPLAGFVDHETGDARRVYKLGSSERMEIVQFGRERMLRESETTVTRFASHVADALAALAWVHAVDRVLPDLGVAERLVAMASRGDGEVRAAAVAASPSGIQTENLRQSRKQLKGGQ